MNLMARTLLQAGRCIGSDAASRAMESLEARLVFAQDLTFDTASAVAMGSGTDGAVVVNVDSITVNTVMRNRGGDGSKGADLKVLLTRDFEIPTTDSADVSIGKFAVPDMGGDTTLSMSRTMVVPNLPSGEYYVFLRLRPYNQSSTLDDVSGILTSGLFGGKSKGDQNKNNLIFTGMKVVIQGTDAPADQGLVTGGVRVSLSGPGVVNQVQRTDGNFDFQVTGTSKSSKLSIGDADGYNHIGDIHIAGPLGTLESKVALTGSLTIDGEVKELKLKNVVNGTITLASPVRDVKITAEGLYQSSIISAAVISKLDIHQWFAGPDSNGLLSAPGVKEIKTEGAFGADVRLTGIAGKPALEKATIKGQIASHSFVVLGNVKQLRADGLAADAAMTVRGEFKQAEFIADTSGVLSALSFQQISMKRSLNAGTILAGAFLGDDARVGGEGDTYGAGLLRQIKIDRSMTSSLIGAGLDPMNGVLGDAGDLFVSVPGSKIEKITAKSMGTGSRFLAPVLPKKASVDGKSVTVAGDSRFVSTLS